MQHVSWRLNVTQLYHIELTNVFMGSPDCEPVPSQRVGTELKTVDGGRGTFVPRQASSRNNVRPLNANRIPSPDGALRNPGSDLRYNRPPGLAALHPGYGYATAFMR